MMIFGELVDMENHIVHKRRMVFLILEYDFDIMLDQLNLVLNNEFDITAKDHKYIKSIVIKRKGKQFIISCWHDDRWKSKAKVIKT